MKERARIRCAYATRYANRVSYLFILCAREREGREHIRSILREHCILEFFVPTGKEKELAKFNEIAIRDIIAR